MSHPASTFDMQTLRRPCRLSLRSGLLALVIALPCAPLLAGPTGDVTRANTTSAPQEQLTSMSGAIDDEALEDMRQLAAAYNGCGEGQLSRRQHPSLLCSTQTSCSFA